MGGKVRPSTASETLRLWRARARAVPVKIKYSSALSAVSFDGFSYGTKR
jgi:hypothetical protein